jgi:hypothetical protein
MWRFLLLLLGLGLTSARAVDTSLLQQVAMQWLDESNRWAFTQHVREYDGGSLKEERVERYDPSQRETSRWRLVSINGRPPTADEWAAWTKRKNKPHRRKPKQVADYFDFAHARVVDETADTVRYQLPLQNNAEWLFPIDKVDLLVTVARRGPALKQVQASVAEPFRVALGLAHVLDVDLDVRMAPPATTDPAEAKPTGSGRAVVSKLGRRVEYVWSDFKHVTPHAEETDSS